MRRYPSYYECNQFFTCNQSEDEIALGLVSREPKSVPIPEIFYTNTQHRDIRGGGVSDEVSNL